MNKNINDKLAEGRQYRSIDLRSFEQRAEGDEMIVTGYATIFNQPYLLWKDGGWEYWEQISDRAFDEADMSDVIMQYDHEGRVFARISNETLAVNPDAVGLRIRADLGGTELGRQLYEEISGGYTTKMSFGFTVREDVEEITEDKEANTVKILRTITAINKLYDVSAVSLPANDATSISARAAGEGAIAAAREEIAKREKRERQKQKIRIITEVLKK